VSFTHARLRVLGKPGRGNRKRLLLDQPTSALKMRYLPLNKLAIDLREGSDSGQGDQTVLHPS
jgi:hypothetical protein